MRISTGLERLNKIIHVTDKLLHSKQIANHGMVLFDTAAYEKKKASNQLLITFIRRNFWYFIQDIMLKGRDGQYTSVPLPQKLTDCIASDFSYEYSNILFSKSGDTSRKVISKKGCLPAGPALAKVTPPKPNMPLLQFSTLHAAIIYHADEHVVGQLCHSLSGTSVGRLLGIEVNC